MKRFRDPKIEDILAKYILTKHVLFHLSHQKNGEIIDEANLFLLKKKMRYVKNMSAASHDKSWQKSLMKSFVHLGYLESVLDSTGKFVVLDRDGFLELYIGRGTACLHTLLFPKDPCKADHTVHVFHEITNTDLNHLYNTYDKQVVGSMNYERMIEPIPDSKQVIYESKTDDGKSSNEVPSFPIDPVDVALSKIESLDSNAASKIFDETQKELLKNLILSIGHMKTIIDIQKTLADRVMDLEKTISSVRSKHDEKINDVLTLQKKSMSKIDSLLSVAVSVNTRISSLETTSVSSETKLNKVSSALSGVASMLDATKQADFTKSVSKKDSIIKKIELQMEEIELLKDLTLDSLSSKP